MKARPVLRRVLQMLTALAAVAYLVACASKVEAPLDLAPPQAGWVVDARSPLIKAGDFREQGLWNDPSVLKVGDEYWMYLTSSSKEPFKPPVVPFRAVSRDGISWRLDPAAPLLSPAGTPFVSIETPSVVYLRGQYHMYYSGIYPAGHVPMMEIGHAISADGVHWTQDAMPAIRSTGKPAEWNGFLVGEPGAVVYKDRVLVYFTAMGARPSGTPPQLQTLGLAISEDGRSFGPARKVLAQSARYPGEKGYPGYSTPAALVDGDTIHLFYDVVHFDKQADPQWRQVALQRAVSHDGGLTFSEAAAPLLRRDDNDWSQGGEVRAPSALIDGRQVKLWFGGHAGHGKLGDMIRRGFKGREFGIGLMTADIGVLRDGPP